MKRKESYNAPGKAREKMKGGNKTQPAKEELATRKYTKSKSASTKNHITRQDLSCDLSFASHEWVLLLEQLHSCEQK